MAHDLSFNSVGSAEMAFRGAKPWHGLGEEMQAGASLEQWRTAAGWMWDAVSSPVQYMFGDVAVQADDKNALYRSDTGALLGIVGSQYKPVQPAEIVEFFRDMVSDAGYQIETMGTLNGGRKLWAMAGKAGMSDDVTGHGDIIKGGLLLATSLDGSTATICQPTSVRVVCANTLAQAQRDKSKMVKVSHRSIFDPAYIKTQLALVDAGYAEFIQSIKSLSKMHITLNEANALLKSLFDKSSKAMDKAANDRATEQEAKLDFARLLGVPADVAKTATGHDKKDNRAVVRCLELFEGAGMGAAGAGVAGTAWGLLNSVTQFVDHEQGRTANARMDKAWFGTGANTKNDCFESLLRRI